MPTTLTVRILGAGVSGLASAFLLAADGHHVELIDERFEAPAVGTSLGLFGPAQSALARLGLLDQVRAMSAAPDAGTLRSADGRILAAVPAGSALLISRSDLVRTLLEALPETVERSRRRVEDVRPLRDGADLLVGADGAHSLVRRSGWPDQGRARSHGVTVLRGTAAIAPPEISETWGRGWLFGITPLAGGGTNWFACLPEHRTESREEDLAHLRRSLGGRRDVIDEVLAAACAEQTLVHGLHTAPAVWPVRQNVVLVGDAAHAMAPNLGHGANTALQDAESLALALRHDQSRASQGPSPQQNPSSQESRSPQSPSVAVARALRRYAATRALPGQGWRLGSEAVLRVAMSSRAAPLRDRVLLSTTGRLAERRSSSARHAERRGSSR